MQTGTTPGAAVGEPLGRPWPGSRPLETGVRCENGRKIEQTDRNGFGKPGRRARRELRLCFPSFPLSPSLAPGMSTETALEEEQQDQRRRCRAWTCVRGTICEGFGHTDREGIERKEEIVTRQGCGGAGEG